MSGPVKSHGRTGEDIQDELKRLMLDPNFTIETAVEPWMRQPGPAPKILYSEISSPAHPILDVPIAPSAKPATVSIQTFYDGKVHRFVPLGGDIVTDKNGRKTLKSFERFPLELSSPMEGGLVGHGSDRMRPRDLLPNAKTFKLVPGHNDIKIYTRSGQMFHNGVLLDITEQGQDKNVHVALNIYPY